MRGQAADVDHHLATMRLDGKGHHGDKGQAVLGQCAERGNALRLQQGAQYVVQAGFVRHGASIGQKKTPETRVGPGVRFQRPDFLWKP